MKIPTLTIHSDGRREHSDEQMSLYRMAALHGYATRVVAEWKAANGKMMLSAEQSRDLADRITDALLATQGLGVRLP